MYSMPDDGQKFELVYGKLVVSPGGFRHSMVGMKILRVIAAFLETHPIGEVLGPDLGIILPNGNLRSPDVTFILNRNLPPEEDRDKFFGGVPDFVVEVLSPGDMAGQVALKIGEFLECGVAIVWLADPDQRTITVYRSLCETHRYTPADTVTAEPVLPGFSSPVSRFF
jgi:Uma2 family endonuclease